MSKPGQNYETAELGKILRAAADAIRIAGAGEAEWAVVLPHLSMAPQLTKGYFRPKKQPEMIP